VISGDLNTRDNRGTVGDRRDVRYETLPPGDGGALVLDGGWQGKVWEETGGRRHKFVHNGPLSGRTDRPL